MSAIGPKRTSLVAPHMSAFDPERHFAPVNCRTAKNLFALLGLGRLLGFGAPGQHRFPAGRSTARFGLRYLLQEIHMPAFSFYPVVMVPSMHRLRLRRMAFKFSPSSVACWLNFTLAPLCIHLTSTGISQVAAYSATILQCTPYSPSPERPMSGRLKFRKRATGHFKRH
jgi:hypothetical protein